jgi:uncharacterized phage protein (TIGR01671 family)
MTNKFRAWDTEDKCWVPPAAVALIGDGVLLRYELNHWHTEYSNRYIAQFFTGLKDKTGRDIYEGDIVEDKTIGTPPALVAWTDGNNGYAPFDHVSALDWSHGARTRWTVDGTEVIGNIYENPELLTP